MHLAPWGGRRAPVVWRWRRCLRPCLRAAGKSPEDMLASAKSYMEKQDLSAASIQLKNALQENGNLAEAVSCSAASTSGRATRPAR